MKLFHIWSRALVLMIGLVITSAFVISSTYLETAMAAEDGLVFVNQSDEESFAIEESEEFEESQIQFDKAESYYVDSNRIRLEPFDTFYAYYITPMKASIRIGGKWTYAKKMKYSTGYDLVFDKLRPNKRYKIRYTCKGRDTGKIYTAYRYVWTAPAKVKYSETTRKWKKSKGAKGYIVYYNYLKYIGYNKYGTKVFRRYFKTKYTSSNNIKLPIGSKLTEIIPYSKHGKYYYLAYDIARFRNMRDIKDSMTNNYYKQYYKV